MNLEPGYTPANLRAILRDAGLTQAMAGEMVGVDARTVRRWCADVSSDDHRDMPLKQWLSLMEKVGL